MQLIKFKIKYKFFMMIELAKRYGGESLLQISNVHRRTGTSSRDWDIIHFTRNAYWRYVAVRINYRLNRDYQHTRSNVGHCHDRCYKSSCSILFRCHIALAGYIITSWRHHPMQSVLSDRVNGETFYQRFLYLNRSAYI